jgi:SAM-dependent methyltransferase
MMNSAGPSAGASGGNSLFRTPAVQAVLIQLSSFLLVLTIAQGMWLLTHAPVTIAGAALMQGVFAAILSRCFGLASWWLIIQLLFPISLVAALSLQLPPAVFLVVFLVLVALYWSTFRTQVPFYPSGRAAWGAVAGALLTDRPIQFIDIGSGLGGMVLHLARSRPESTFTGIEIAPLPWFVSFVRGCMSRGKSRFIRGDYEHLDFASYDVVFAYLSPAAMPALWEKARAEMQSGALLLSYEFTIPDIEPHLISTPVDGGPVLYGWYM